MLASVSKMILEIIGKTGQEDQNTRNYSDVMSKNIRKEMQQRSLQSLDTKKQRADNQIKGGCVFIHQIHKAVDNTAFRFALTKQICLFRNCHDMELIKRTSHLS